MIGILCDSARRYLQSASKNSALDPATKRTFNQESKPMLTKLPIKGVRNLTKGRLKQKWAKFTDAHLRYVERKFDELFGRIQKRSGWSVLWLVAIFGTAYVGASAAQAMEMPMTSMSPSDEGSQAASMTEMMGDPGLMPFDIMTGQAGKWMVGYEFMFEKMDGNLVGSNDISEREILNRFFAAPTDMTMEMHMLMVMYAPTDKLTLMMMLPYIFKDMNHLTADGGRFAERTNGIGDIELRGTYSIFATKDLRHRLFLNGGVGLPTGSIDETMDGMQLEYPMQLGSGTVSLLPGFTYLGQAAPWGWAADFGSTVQLGRNDRGYRQGNRYQLSVSIARQLTNSVSLLAGARGELWENISGADSELDPNDEPTKDTNLQGGRRLNVVLGITFHPQSGVLKGQHFHVQGEVPVVQSLDGPQLQRSWAIRCGWQVEF